MSRHIGIVGVSPEGAALCYRQIFRRASATLPQDQHPTVSIHNLPLARYIAAIQSGDWEAVGKLLAASAAVLAGCGADFCFSPDNVVQYAVPLAETHSPIPWLAMTELVASAVERDGRRVVGIIGTRMVTSGSAYQTRLGLRGIRVLPPEPEESEAVDAVIFKELIFGRIVPASQQRVLGIIDGLARRGCEGVILGCSEAPLLITPDNSPIPVYDSVDLLAAGSLDRATR